jgi:hypothetical protein
VCSSSEGASVSRLPSNARDCKLRGRDRDDAASAPEKEDKAGMPPALKAKGRAGLPVRPECAV